MINELALFAGAGGGLLASKLLGWRTVCYVEWDAYAVEVLRARIRDGHLDDAPIWDDCFSFNGKPWAGCVDIVTAGFPCQPFSNAGKGLAENDPRNGWPAVKRIIGEVRPRFAFLENVPGLISKPYIRRIFGDLAEVGYDAEWGTLSAAAVGANHKRERLWIVAYAAEWQGNLAEFSRQESVQPTRDGAAPEMADADNSETARQRKYGRKIHANTKAEGFDLGSPTFSDAEHNPMANNQHHNQTNADSFRVDWWAVEPELGRVADGVAHRVERLRAIGNGQVPAVARAAFIKLMERMDNE